MNVLSYFDNTAEVSEVNDIFTFLQQARRERHALIIREDMENFAKGHLREIIRSYPCAGILVEQTHSGVAYHVTSTNPQRILKNGLRGQKDVDAGTFGGGVVYTYPSLSSFSDLWTIHNVFAVTYGPGSLRSIITVDKCEKEQGEICIPPKCIITIEYLGVADVVLERFYSESSTYGMSSF